MSAHENLDRRPQVKGSSDRSFGLVWSVVLALVALFPLIRGNPVRWWALGTSAAFLAAALLAPRLLHPFNLIWMRIGLLLHKVTNPVILGILFFVFFTPFGFLLRMFGKKLIPLGPDSSPSYWLRRDPPGPAPDSFPNQF